LHAERRFASELTHELPLSLLRGHRPSQQVRADYPEAIGEPHPRAVEMSEAMREGAVTPRDLVGRGFTFAEQAEYHEEARRIAMDASVRQVAPQADRLSDIILKAREAVSSHMPVPRKCKSAQALTIAWGGYCTARAAYHLDPWDRQRERCIERLRAFFAQTDTLPGLVNYVVSAVDETMTIKSRN